MSACKVCSKEATSPSPLFCEGCVSVWQQSPERLRIVGVEDEQRCNVALVDFITRTRAERQNGGKS